MECSSGPHPSRRLRRRSTFPLKGGRAAPLEMSGARLFAGWRTPLTVAAFGLIGLTLALAVADRLNPISRTRADDRSVIVTAADGTLLRAFASRDGAWRLPVKPEQVDARYLRLLLAWEDQRFREHPGVDPVAMLRATYQM